MKATPIILLPFLLLAGCASTPQTQPGITQPGITQPETILPETPQPEITPQSRAEALQTQCDVGDIDACTELGIMYSCTMLGEMHCDLPQNDTRAREFFERACNADNTDACAHLAEIYYYGRGVPRDYDHSAELLLKACNLNNPEACFEAAKRYASHEQVTTPDSKLAVKLYEKACDAEVFYSCQLLGLMHYHGHGVPRDETHGLKIIQSACDAGDHEACEIAEDAPNHPALNPY